MHIAFYCSSKSRCQAFARIFEKGLEANKHTMEVRDVYGAIDAHCDAAVILGVQQRATFDLLQANNIPFAYLDKGYTRTWDYRRVALNAAQPTHYMQYWMKPSDRREKFNWWFELWHRSLPTSPIIIATSSTNYHTFSGIASPQYHTTMVLNELRKYTDRPVVFRQKPNQTLAVEVEGTIKSTAPLLNDLSNAHCLITYGSSACLTAMQVGVPSIILGDAIMRPISSCRLKYVEDPCYATDRERERLLNNLAYCQWSIAEFESGEAWQEIERGLFDGH